MTNLLKGVVQHGTGVYAKQLKRSAAGKQEQRMIVKMPGL